MQHLPHTGAATMYWNMYICIYIYILYIYHIISYICISIYLSIYIYIIKPTMVLWRILVYLFSNKIQWDNLCIFFWHFCDLLKFFPKAPVKGFSQRTAAKFNFSLHLHNISIHLPTSPTLRVRKCRKYSKVILCDRRNTFAWFSEHKLYFSWQAQHFGGVHVHFAWHTQHFRRVVLRIFCESHWRAEWSGDTAQITWHTWHFVTCDENWRKPRTKHRFWGGRFWGSSGTCRNMPIL